LKSSRKLFAAVKKLAPKIKLISAERIRDELIKLFQSPRETDSLSSAKGGEGRGEEQKIPTFKTPHPNLSRLSWEREKNSCASAVWICCAKVICSNTFFAELAATIDCEHHRIFILKAAIQSHLPDAGKLPPDSNELLPWTSFASRHRKNQ